MGLSFVQSFQVVLQVSPVSGAGSMFVIVFIIGAAFLFVLGLLLGEQWHRHRLAHRNRELASARREIDALAEALRARRGGVQ